MTSIAAHNQGLGRHPGLAKWFVFGAVSLAFFFLNMATFTSLGVVLYTMVAELHWSQTAAGFSFTFLGLACGLSSPLPAITMKWWGGRITICLGAALLVIGFFLASISQSVAAFYIAMTFLGLGYSFAGNVPGVYLIAAWFEKGSSRVIGYYLMLGALGAACGPPVVVWIVGKSGSWRGHWQAMAAVSLVIGVACFVLVRDALVKPEATPEELIADPTLAHHAAEWDPRRAVFTAQFMLIAAAMAATMACVTTYNSVAVPHLVKLGASPQLGAFVLSTWAITATLFKALAGRLCESVKPTILVAIGLVLQALGSAILGYADTSFLRYSGAVSFGTGWGLAYVAGTVVLLDYFGRNTGSKILSIVWLLTTIAAAGPPLAGRIADDYGSFAPIFLLYAAILVVLAVPIFIMRQPAAMPGSMASSGKRPEPFSGKIEAV